MKKNKIKFTKNILIVSFISLAFGTLSAGNLFKDSNFSKKNGWKIGVTKPVLKAGGSVLMKDGELVIRHPKQETHTYELQVTNNINFEIDKKYRLKFDAAISSPGVIEVVYGTRKPPYKTYCRSWIKIIPQKKQYEYVLNFKKNIKGKYEPDRQCIFRLYFGANKELNLKLSNIFLGKLQDLNLSKSWKLFLGVKAPTSYVSIPRVLKNQYGKEVAPQLINLKNNSVNLASLANGAFEEGDTAVLYNEFKCDKAGMIQLGLAADWWMEVYVNGQKEYSTLKEGNRVNTYLPGDHVFYFPAKAGENILAVKVLSGSKGWKFICGVPQKKIKKPSRHTVKFNKNPEWKIVDMSSLQVKKDSALDLSSLVDAPAGKHGRLIVNNKGLLAFVKNPSLGIRLRGFNGVPRAVWQQPREKDFEETARLFAKAARRQGYRLIRLNMLECALTSRAPKGMLFNPLYLKRWDSIIAKLKAEGIYVHLVLASYGLYYSPFSFEGEVMKNRNEHKLRMSLGAKSERSHWKNGVEKLLNHVNPYTGLAWKDDPAIAIVEFYNEQENGVRKVSEISAAKPKIRSLVEKKWRTWLKNKFKNKIPQALAKELKSTNFNNAPIPNMRGELLELSNQFSLFIGYLAKENALWFENIVRKTGYPGLVTQYNFSKKLIYSAARWELAQVVEMNGYFCHPHNNQIDQYSSIEKSAAFWRSINSTRLAGRPFLVTEFNHSFWNSYQHENGLVMGAYSALQGYGSIMIHSGPVVLKVDKRALRSFTSGSSPVIRANEFLAACLFQRADVRKSLNNLELQISNKFLKIFKNSDKPVNSSQGKLALMTGFSLAFPELSKAHEVPKELPKPSMTLLPQRGGNIVGTEWYSSVLDSNDGSFSLSDAVTKLKAAKILPAGNLSDPEKGIFQSDTGEITMRSKEKLLKVVSPRTEAVSMLAGKSETMKQLHVKSSSVPATIAICSVDNKALISSSRMVLIYSTELANSGMELSYDHKRMLKKGKLPILMKTGKLSALFKNNNAANMSLYALSMDGSRKERLPLEYVNGNLKINIDTKTLKNGPTTFFELTIK